MDLIKTYDIDAEGSLLNGLTSAIRETRKRKGITQAHLSQMTGIPQKTISRIENRKDFARLDTLYKLLSAMDVKVSITIEETIK